MSLRLLSGGFRKWLLRSHPFTTLWLPNQGVEFWEAGKSPEMVNMEAQSGQTI
jgi:hypothetical protein